MPNPRYNDRGKAINFLESLKNPCKIRGERGKTIPL